MRYVHRAADEAADNVLKAKKEPVILKRQQG